MTNDLTVTKQNIYLNPMMQRDTFSHMVEMATFLSKGESLPPHFKNRPADLLRLCEVSARTGISLFALLDECYFVKGRFSYSGKMIAAMVNLSTRIVGSLSYTFLGDKIPADSKKHYPELSVVVCGRLEGESEERTVTVPWTLGFQDSQGATERWRNDPFQMLYYYGARVWARRHAPEVIAGLVAIDEVSYETHPHAVGEIVDKVVEDAVVIESKQNLPPSDIYISYYDKLGNANNIDDLTLIRDELKKNKSKDLSEDERVALRKVYQTRMSQIVSEGELLKAGQDFIDSHSDEGAQQ